MDEVRKIKPDVPLIGENGIPLNDEIELEKNLKWIDMYYYSKEL